MNTRPLFDKLPTVFRDLETEHGQITDALTRWVDELLIGLGDRLTSMPNDYADPMTAPADYLDTIATGLPISVFSDFWAAGWDESIKRALLANGAYINQWRGDRRALERVLEIFGFSGVQIAPKTGWIVGKTPLPAPPGGTIYDYQLRIPARYGRGTYERSIIDAATRWALPLWWSIEVQEY